MKRRDFLKYLGVGLSGPAFRNLFRYKQSATEHLMPYVIPPDGVVPGIPNWYASVCQHCTAGCGIHVKVREGRAKKIEGNPDFPVNFGKVCARGQAGLQALYNPDRITEPLIKAGGKFQKISWDRALSTAAERFGKVRRAGESDKTVIITGPLRGTVSKLFSDFAANFGTGQVYSYDLLHDDALLEANRQCFGDARFPHYDIANAKYVLSFGANFLDTWATPVKHSVSFGRLRDPAIGTKRDRGWLVHFEPRLSITGASADVWMPINPGSEGRLALAIAHAIISERLHNHEIGLNVAEWEEALEPFSAKAAAKETGVAEKEINKIAREFAENRPALALCGGQGTAQVDGTFNGIASNLLNYLVGSVGAKGGIRFNAPAPFDGLISPNTPFSNLAKLSEKMADLEVKAALIYNANPVFNLPRAVGFEKNFRNIPFVVSFSAFMDETTAMADLVLPDHDSLESWGDFVPLVDWGRQTIGLAQPVITPLHNTRPVGDTLLALAKMVGHNPASALPQAAYVDYLKDSWRALFDQNRAIISEQTFEDFWDKSVQRGGWWRADETYTAPAHLPTPDLVNRKTGSEPEKGEHEFDLCLFPSHGQYDGRGANLPWLQQLPEPLVTVAWGTWAEVNRETAAELEVTEGDLVDIESSHGKITVPIYIYEGIKSKTVAVPIGQGHTEYGRYAKGRGANPLKVLGERFDEASGALAWAATKVKITKLDTRARVVKTDPELDLPGMENGLREIDRHIVQWISPAEANELGEEELEPINALPTRDLRKGPHFLSGIGLGKYRESRYHDYKYRWGMVIDLDKCTGCSACMVACYAENNLPIVDENELAKHRHKNWIRIDRYWEGEFPEIRAKVMPVNCYQCGNAPCEPVCPVYAAFHTKDGLNGQVYQRCAGTRYCNVNCPYRARLFNWSNSEWPEPLDQQLNPDLSVRSAGMTDKCSFCVQRIRYSKDIAKDEKRRVRDGEITPACAQTCPTGAITFGDLLDTDTRVSQLTKNPRRFRVFEELMNTEPAVVYLKAVREGAEHEAEAGGHGSASEAGAPEPAAGSGGSSEEGAKHE